MVLDEDITKYGGLDKGIFGFANSGNATILSYDNGAKMEWVDSIATSRKFDQNLVAKFNVPVGEEDTENRTQVYNNKLVGDYEVEVTMDVKLSDGSWDSAITSNPYGYYSTGYSPDGSSFQYNLPVNDEIIWTSSRTDIITNDGKMVDDVVLTEATPVTLNATSKGVSKAYNLVVAPRTKQVTLSTGTIPHEIKLANKKNANVSADVTAEFIYTHSTSKTGKVNIINDNGEVLASMIATTTGIYFDYKNSDYKVVSLADGQSVNIEFVVMPDVDKVAAV